jgi:hypothetical protein
MVFMCGIQMTSGLLVLHMRNVMVFMCGIQMTSGLLVLHMRNAFCGKSVEACKAQEMADPQKQSLKGGEGGVSPGVPGVRPREMEALDHLLYCIKDIKAKGHYIYSARRLKPF